MDDNKIVEIDFCAEMMMVGHWVITLQFVSDHGSVVVFSAPDGDEGQSHEYTIDNLQSRSFIERLLSCLDQHDNDDDSLLHDAMNLSIRISYQDGSEANYEYPDSLRGNTFVSSCESLYSLTRDNAIASILSFFDIDM